MKILLIEDDPFKEEPIKRALKFVHLDSDISVGRSVQEAIEYIRSNCYNLIVLDISLPSHESLPGGAQPIPQPSGGVEILLDLAYEERRDKIVIVTQYPEIEFNGQFYPLVKFPKTLKKSINVNLTAIILFNTQTSEWKEPFKKAVT